MKKWSFIHVPKTGGTTIIRYLEQYINNTIHADTNKVVNEEKYSLIFGHYNPNLYPDRKKIIWLRHPVDRVISNYFHWKWRMKNSHKRFIIIDDHTRRFPDDINVVDFAKKTLHVYKFFTNNYDINRFDYVGFQENMNEDLKGLCVLLNIPFDESKIGHYRNNQKPENVIISKNERQNLVNLLKEDIYFYEKVKKETGSSYK